MRPIGVDLGTTNSVVATIDESGRPEVLVNAEGGRLTPSAVAVMDGSEVVGEVARREASRHPDRVALSIKRLMGSTAHVNLAGEQRTPEQISAMILAKLVTDATERLGGPPSGVVITVPAYFDDGQRRATKDAAELAGLNVLRIINEPTAAALAYGMNDRDEPRPICVYDLGGGTFDVSVLDVGGGVMLVKSTAGDTRLGGDDFDQAIVDWAIETFRVSAGVDLAIDETAVARLREAAEEAKRTLTASESASISLPYVAMSDGVPLHLELTLTRRQFEDMIERDVDRTIACVQRAIDDAGMSRDEIVEVLLVGGSTRVPLVRRKLAEFFGRTPNATLNADEVVAIGAACQAAIIGGEITEVVLVDVTPLTLGVETLGGIVDPLIRRNTTIPTTRKKVFTTANDDQDTVEIHITQGERPLARDNITLGRFKLTGIPPATAGVPKIEVSFDIDVDGVVTVSARDLATDNESSVTLFEMPRVDRDIIEEAKRSRDDHRVEDEAAVRLIRGRLELQAMIKRAEKLLEDNAHRLDEEETELLWQAIEDAREGLEGAESPLIVEEIGSALLEELRVVGEVLYADATIRRVRSDEFDRGE